MPAPVTAPHPARRPHLNDRARALTLVGVGLLAACAVAANIRGGFWSLLLTPLGTLGAILAIDGWVHRKRGESLLISHPGRFALMAVGSIVFWGFFEVLNFRINNWHYVGLPDHMAWRWAGILSVAALVIPFVMELADLLDTAGLWKSASLSPFHRSGRVLFPVLGCASLALPLLWPDPFFPLVWTVPFLLLEPVAEALGAPSLLSDWKSGAARRAALLVGAGLIAGLLWQWLNVHAAARWIFTVPHLDHWKILDMPILGYLGFVPLAFSAHTAGAVGTRAWDRARAPARWALMTAVILWVVAALLGVDHFTRQP